jgi:hypothetical protein
MRNRKFKDICGKKINQLTVIQIVGKNKYGNLILCKCDCGNETILNVATLTEGRTSSCGCSKIKAGRRKMKNICGMRFGKLIVMSINEEPRKRNGTYWNCLCDCGNWSVRIAHSLISGHVTSCGCNAYSHRFKKKADTPLNTIFYGYKRSAKQRGYPFNLTKDEFRIIIKQNCYYCGIEPQQASPSTCKEIYLYNGIDRKDSSFGYEKENVVPCCGTCNYAKRSMTLSQFKEWIKKVYLNIIKED